RRHTRFSRDWSSDVCSSDLRRGGARRVAGEGTVGVGAGLEGDVLVGRADRALGQGLELVVALAGEIDLGLAVAVEVVAGDPHPRSEERRVGKEWRARGARGP